MMPVVRVRKTSLQRPHIFCRGDWVAPTIPANRAVTIPEGVNSGHFKYFLPRSRTVVPAIPRYDEAAPGVQDQKAPVNVCSLILAICGLCVLSFRCPPSTTSANREELGRLEPPYGCRFVPRA